MRSRRRSCVVETEGRDDTTASSRPHQNLTTLLSSEPNNTTPMPVRCVFLCRKGTSMEKISARVECLSCSRTDPCESAKTCFCSVDSRSRSLCRDKNGEPTQIFHNYVDKNCCMFTATILVHEQGPGLHFQTQLDGVGNWWEF